MHENAKKALQKAIRDFFTLEDIMSEEYLRDAAQNFVYENEEDIRETLRDQIDTYDLFTNLMDEINFYDIW